MRESFIGVGLTVALAGVGCSGSGRQDAITGVPQAQAAEMQAARTGFDAATEPALTAETRYAAGRVAESRGDLNQAIRQYEEALKLDPKHAAAMYHLGVIHTQLKDFPRATALWERYLVATGHAASGYANLGYCHEQAGRIQQAEDAYRAGIKKDPTNGPCRINLGLLLARQGRVADAREQLSRVLPPEEVYYNLGSVFEQEGFYSLSRSMYEAALAAVPDFEPARTRLSRLPSAPKTP